MRIMFRPHTVLTIGLWLILVSFLGIPSSWKTKLYIATGIFLVCGYLYHLGHEVILKLAARQPQEGDSFAENGNSTTSGTTPKT
ncbi:MAG: hypothetical protein A2664_00920 [Candidatus Taylorbacteria bacterium RIFCSPHIGHO2_01_FULL_46_22b]|uniref:Uncharacterized protein n=1 Tax=Candidatus Taylorbacteria bacterium RIFCSPHIGHO2_01_FULL_46_22b TaxID=1802301 RepID=A0A1G2M629_9BACT|nr:MAG: hypothetical protein A2664_00920 [Candidatus Taylorbacteria bacterium RIFCSPHIGHO2_01_FULL_46_22b]